MSRSKWTNLGAAALVVAVVGTIIGALFVVGSPMEARKEKADIARAERLEDLVREVRQFRLTRSRLPESIEAMAKQSGARQLRFQDPVSGKPLEYRVLDEKRFEVCADFETDTSNKPAYSSYNSEGRNFNIHGKGRICFELPAKRQ